MGPTTPVIQVPGRTFPVTPYFLEDAVELSNYRLEMDSDSPYVDRHSRESLVLLDHVAKMLTCHAAGNRGKYSDEVLLDDEVEEDEHSQIRSGYSRQTQSTLKAMNEQMINFDLMLSLLETICFGNAELQAYSAAILVFLPSLDTIRTLCDLLEGHPRFGSKDFQVFPLHSSISNEQQARVFEVSRCPSIVCIPDANLSVKNPDAASWSPQNSCINEHCRNGCHYPRHHSSNRFRQA